MHNSGFISSQNRSGQVEKERKKKIIIPILPTRPWIENSKKKGNKIKKNLKAPFRLHFKPKRVGTGREREEKKLSFQPFLPDSEWKIQKKREKKLKKLKSIIQASFHAKRGRDRSRMREKKIYRSDPSYLTQNRKFRKK